jgi:hypothetical protein
MMTSPRIASDAVNTQAFVFRDHDHAMKEEALPFTIRVVSNIRDLEKAVRIRHAAYMRHVPGFAQELTLPENSDSEQGVVVLLAESKFDGSPVGTMRIQTNDHKPLSLEQSVALPEAYRTRRLAEATRLGVTQERVGRMVTTALFKAFFLYCRQNRIDHMVITARSPVDRQYDRLLFTDVYPELGYIPFKHVGGMPHRVMALDVNGAERLWSQARHPLLNFILHTFHEDINVVGTSLYQSRFPNVESSALPADAIAPLASIATPSPSLVTVRAINA